MRESILNGIKACMFPLLSSSSPASSLDNSPAGSRVGSYDHAPLKTATSVTSMTSSGTGGGADVVSVIGMGGSGKTVIASAVVRDTGETAVAVYFSRIVFLAFGQTPVLRDVAMLAYSQLTGRSLGQSNDIAFDELLSVLADAAFGVDVLLVMDDVWEPAHAEALNFVDRGTDSRVLVTTRLKGVFPGAREFELGVLSLEDGAALLLECAGEARPGPPPLPKLLSDAVDLCGRLPLLLSIAGSMLEQHGTSKNHV